MCVCMYMHSKLDRTLTHSLLTQPTQPYTERAQLLYSTLLSYTILSLIKPLFMLQLGFICMYVYMYVCIPE